MLTIFRKRVRSQYFSENLVASEIEPGLWICSQELRPLDHRGGLLLAYNVSEIPQLFPVSLL
jgi:hypothetical protein